MPVFGLPSIFEDGYKTIHDDPQQALGSCYVMNTDDVKLSYVRFSEDVRVGDAVRTKYDHYTGDISEAVAVGTQKIEGSSFKTNLAGIPEEPTLRDYAKISIVDGPGAGQQGYITHYTDTVLNIRWYNTDDGALKTPLTTGSDYAIWAPWYVERAFSDAVNATKGTVNGIVIAGAKKDQYGLIAVEGDFPVQVNMDVNAGDLLIPGLTANQGEGDILSGADAPPPYATVNHSLDLSDVASGELHLVEATVYCKPISIVREIAESLIRGTPRPEAV